MIKNAKVNILSHYFLIDSKNSLWEGSDDMGLIS